MGELLRIPLGFSAARGPRRCAAPARDAGAAALALRPGLVAAPVPRGWAARAVGAGDRPLESDAGMRVAGGPAGEDLDSARDAERIALRPRAFRRRR